MVGLTRITEEVKCAQIWDISQLGFVDGLMIRVRERRDSRMAPTCGVEQPQVVGGASDKGKTERKLVDQWRISSFLDILLISLHVCFPL